jgi:hypothetical protein
MNDTMYIYMYMCDKYNIYVCDLYKRLIYYTKNC